MLETWQKNCQTISICQYKYAIIYNQDAISIPTISRCDVLCKNIDQQINNHICLKNLSCGPWQWHLPGDIWINIEISMLYVV